MFNAIKFFGDNLAVVNYVTSSIFMIAGMLSIKTINNLFATMFTIDKISANAMDAGEKGLSATKEFVTKAAGAGMALAHVAAPHVMFAAKRGLAAGRMRAISRKTVCVYSSDICN